MSDLVNSLRFHGRFGNETEERARMRRYRERCEAASRIEALEAKLAECRAAQPAPIRDWSEDFAHENGNYENLCSACQCVFYGHKRRSTCKACAAQPAPIPAQTGTEEAAGAPKLSQDQVIELLLGGIIIDSGARMLHSGHEMSFSLEELTDLANAARNSACPAEASAGNALTEEAKDAAHKVEGHLKAARDALQRLEATLSVLHEDREPIMAATIASVALVLEGDSEAAREAIDAAIASHIKAGQAGKDGS